MIVQPNWSPITFDEAFTVLSDGGKRLKQKNYLPAGQLPVIDQGAEPVGGYTNDLNLQYEGPLPALLFGDHTRRFKYADHRFVVGAEGVKILVPRSCLLPKFAFYQLIGTSIPDRGYGRHFALLKALRIYAPPLTEQQRIVEVIEEQFSHLDAAEASLTRVEYRASALVESAYKTVLPDWSYVSLSSIARTSSGGTPSRRKAENFCGAIPWIKSGELGDSQVRVTAERISDRGLASSSAKLLKRGTLMMAMYGATVGKLGILDMDSAATNQAVCAIEPHDPDLVPFLWLCLRAMRRDLIDSAKGGAQPNISQGIIRDLRIPMPLPDDRTRLVTEISRQVDACERIVAAARKGRVRALHLRRAILERAFSGRLVLQTHGEDAVLPASDVLAPSAGLGREGGATAPLR